MGLLRTFAERLARRIVLKRRLPSEFGNACLYVTPDSALSYLRPDFRRHHDHLFSVASTINVGDRVWEVGANVGLLAVLAAAKVGATGQIVAIEPDPTLALLIRRSAKGNKFSHLSVIIAAVSRSPGIETLLIAERGRSSNALETIGEGRMAGGVRESHPVPCITLDQLFEKFGPPSLVKIDVEGAELFVLEGATRLLAEARPRFYIETAKEHREMAGELFKRHGYRLFDGQHMERGEISSCAFNTFAVPQ